MRVIVISGIVIITEQVQKNEREEEYEFDQLMVIMTTHKNADDGSRQVTNGTCGVYICIYIYVYIYIYDGRSRKVATLLLLNRIMEIYNSAFLLSLSHCISTRK